MAFIVRNEGFICGFCGEENPPADKTCRNHCRKCLRSLHVDNTPGDRESSCHGKMDITDIFADPKKEYVLVHTCTVCEYVQRNKCAIDDDREVMFEKMKEIAEKKMFS